MAGSASSRAGSSWPLWAKKATGFSQATRRTSASAIPLSRMSATVFGTLRGSLTPQSAALLTRIRSVPKRLTSATMRGSSIFVEG